MGFTNLASIPPSQQTGFIVWSPFTGDAVPILALLLFAIGAATLFAGYRLKKDIKLPMPRTWIKAVVIVVWILQILILLRIFKHIEDVDPSAGITGPVLPITIASAIGVFAFVAYRLRLDGLRTAFGGGFIAALAGPMVFELPFVLIVAPVSSVPTDPGATLTIPFFVALLTSLTFLTFSPKAAITKYAAYSFGAMFLVFAVWALFGYAYPSDAVLFALNSISKVLGFATTAAMFVRAKSAGP